MATNRLLPHTATIFTEIGEDENYRMKYAKRVLKRVYLETEKAYQGDQPIDKITMYAFDTKTIGEAGMQLKADGNEYLVPYDASAYAKPPNDARTIRRVVRRKAGSPRMWHWEVHAQ